MIVSFLNYIGLKRFKKANTKMKNVSFLDIAGSINDLFMKGQDRGFSTGFKRVDEFYRVKMGCTTYITGIPSYGKTQFLFEILMNTSVNHGLRHAIYTPETGSAQDVWIKLIQTYTKKRFNDYGANGSERMTLKEVNMAGNYLTQFFTVIDSGEESPSPGSLLSFAVKLKSEFNPNTLTLDPWNELAHNFALAGGREDKYLEFTLGEVRRAARAQNIHIFIIAHPRTLKMDSSGKYNAPTAYEISGGGAWYSKAESIICIHRPDEDTNITQVMIQKAKPAIIGKKGVAELTYSLATGRYSEGSASDSPTIYNEPEPLF